MQIVSEEFLSLGVNDPAEISENQLILLDIDPDKKALWFELALGKKISDARAELFVLLKGITTKSNQDKIIKNYKLLQKFRKDSLSASESTPVLGKADVSFGKKEESIAKATRTKDIQAASGDVIVYCDGGCSPNPGQCGSGISVYRGGQVAELWYGLYESMGTNNTAELNALYQSLLIAQKEISLGNRVEIKCDSMYAINCIQTWAVSWERNGWRKKGGEIKNLEIIQKAYSLYNELKSKIILSHIKAHAGLEGNELADRMTVHAREQKNPAFVRYEDVINVEEILSMRAG